MKREPIPFAAKTTSVALSTVDVPAASTIAPADEPPVALAEEAEALRVEALVASHNEVGAREVGKAYLARHPRGAYAQRVSGVLDTLP